MKSFAIGIVLAIVCVILGAVLRSRYDNYRASGALMDEARRAQYLIPKKDSPTYKEWVTKYGDTAESWSLFTVAFHTQFLRNLDSRLKVLEEKLSISSAMPDPNHIVPGNQASNKTPL